MLLVCSVSELNQIRWQQMWGPNSLGLPQIGVTFFYLINLGW